MHRPEAFGDDHVEQSPDRLFGRVAEHAFRGAVPGDNPVPAIRADDRVGGRSRHGLEASLPIDFDSGEPLSLELVHDELSQLCQRLPLAGGQALRARDDVLDAQGADREALGRDKRGPGVEADRLLPRDERRALEAGIQRRVGNDHHLPPQDGMGAEGAVPVRAASLDAEARQEVLPIFSHEGDDGDRNTKDAPGVPEDHVETAHRAGGGSLVTGQGGQAFGLVCNGRRERRPGHYDIHSHPIKIQLPPVSASELPRGSCCRESDRGDRILKYFSTTEHCRRVGHCRRAIPELGRGNKQLRAARESATRETAGR